MAVLPGRTGSGGQWAAREGPCPPSSRCVPPPASQWPLVFQNAQCIPDGLAAYYAEQDAHSPDRLYAIVNHYDLAKQSVSRSASPWMSVLSEEKLSEQETEAAEKSA